MKSQSCVYILFGLFILRVDAAQLTMPHPVQNQNSHVFVGQKVDEPVRARQVADRDAQRVISAPAAVHASPYAYSRVAEASAAASAGAEEKAGSQNIMLSVAELTATDIEQKQQQAHAEQARQLLIKVLQEYAFAFGDVASEDPALGKAMYDLAAILLARKHQPFVRLIDIADEAIVKIYESRAKIPAAARIKMGNIDFEQQRVTIGAKIADELCRSLEVGYVNSQQEHARTLFALTVFDVRLACLQKMFKTVKLQQLRIPQAYQERAIRDQIPADVQKVLAASCAASQARSNALPLSQQNAAALAAAASPAARASAVSASPAALPALSAAQVSAAPEVQGVQRNVPAAAQPTPQERSMSVLSMTAQVHPSFPSEMPDKPVQPTTAASGKSEKEKAEQQDQGDFSLAMPSSKSPVRHDPYKILKQAIVAKVMEQAGALAKSKEEEEMRVGIALNTLIGYTMREDNFRLINTIVKIAMTKIEDIINKKGERVAVADPIFALLRTKYVQVMAKELSRCFEGKELTRFEQDAGIRYGGIIFDVSLAHIFKISGGTNDVGISWGNLIKMCVMGVACYYGKAEIIKYGKPLFTRFGNYLMTRYGMVH